MGQIVRAIMYGVEQPKRVRLWSDDEDPGLLDRWADHSGELYGSKHGIDASEPDKAPHWRRVIGYWAFCPEEDVGAGGPMFVSLPMLRRSKELVRARKSWRRFATWARKQGVKLPRPQLWIVPAEVA